MSNSPEHDQIQSFIFENVAIRGAIVRLNASYQVAMGKHPYPSQAQTLLGEALCLVTLLANSVKIEGSISLQAQGDGPIRLLLAESTHDFHVRGLVQHQGILLNPSLPELFGKGVLAITTKATALPTNYQGLVPLVGESLSQAIESYFLQSEQIPTRFILACDQFACTGLFLQALPGQDKYQTEQDWQHIVTLANTITQEELLNLNNAEILHRLFHQETVRVFDSSPVSFRCSCSRTRMESVLLTLGETELESILKEFGAVETFCEFCNHHYLFDAVDIHKILADPGYHSHSSSEH